MSKCHIVGNLMSRINLVFEISNCGTSAYTMDHPDSGTENFVGLKKAKNYVHI